MCLFVLHRFVCSAAEIVCFSCTVLLERPIVSSTDSSGQRLFVVHSFIGAIDCFEHRFFWSRDCLFVAHRFCFVFFS
jgi:hypothetical protein